ncbi:hypothetical protein Hanom_Chr01g00090861 [Helianthus anomalus]
MICSDVSLFNHWQPALNLPSERRHGYVHRCGRRDTIQFKLAWILTVYPLSLVCFLIFSKHTQLCQLCRERSSEKGSRPTVFWRTPKVPIRAMICGDVSLFNHWQPASNLPSERRHGYVRCCGRRDTIQMSRRWFASRNPEKGQTKAVEGEGNNGNVCPQ